MSFTQNELQSFSTLLDQKLTQQKRELERNFDQRMQVFKREIEQRLAYTQQELVRTLAQHFSEQQRKLKETLGQKLTAQMRLSSTTTSGPDAKEQIGKIIEQALDTQLVSFNQLISQRFTVVDEAPSLAVDGSGDFAGIEVQTEIPWDELADAVNKALDERFVSLHESLKGSVSDIEQYLSEWMQQLRGGLVQPRTNVGFEEPILPSETANTNGTITNMQDVFTSIERLEHIIESMQVTMTSNHALLSNRIYHHQQLPLERAHVRGQEVSAQNVTTTKGLQALSKESDAQ